MANFLYQFQAPYGKVGIKLISNEKFERERKHMDKIANTCE